MPKQQYKPALTDAELAARAPDSTISPHGPLDPQSYDTFHGEPYVNKDLQIVEDSDSEPEAQPPPKKQSSKRSVQASTSTTRNVTQAQVHVPRASQPQADLLADAPFKLDGKVGEVAAAGLCFVPVLALSRFPYKFLTKDAYHASEDIADGFFNDGKFWTRSWDMSVLSTTT